MLNSSCLHSKELSHHTVAKGITHMHVFACNNYYIVLQPSKYTRNSYIVEHNIVVNFVPRFIQERVAVQLSLCCQHAFLFHIGNETIQLGL